MTKILLKSIDDIIQSLKKPITKKEGCTFCNISNLDVGQSDKRGAVVIYKTGQSLNDWYGLLQTSTIADPNTGFRILLLPNAHLIHFAQQNINQKIAENFGKAISELYEIIIRTRKDTNYQSIASQVLNAKVDTEYNTQEHLHYKIDEGTGVFDQPSFADADYLKKEKVFNDYAHVKCLPGEKINLAAARLNLLAKTLINHSSKLRGI